MDSEVLQVMENDLRPPARNEARIKVWQPAWAEPILITVITCLRIIHYMQLALVWIKYKAHTLRFRSNLMDWAIILLFS